jgi:hypothetical protein
MSAGALRFRGWVELTDHGDNPLKSILAERQNRQMDSTIEAGKERKPKDTSRSLAAYEPVERKSSGKSHNDRPAAGRRTPGRRATGPAKARASTPTKTGKADRKPAHGRARQAVQHVESEQEPRTVAYGFPSAKQPLSAEAREVLAKVDMGGIPLMITLNLERIAGEHGIGVGVDMTPNDLVRRLRELA